jgi:predicted phosphodiesterase
MEDHQESPRPRVSKRGKTFTYAVRPALALPVVVSLAHVGCVIETLHLRACAADGAECASPVEVRTEVATPVGADGVLRFFAVGDAGVADGADPTKMNGPASVVLALVRRVCGAPAPSRACDFGVFLGDNVYDHGVEDETRGRFLDGFAEAYSEGFTVPLYFVLGNHDYSPITATTARARRELARLETLSASHDDRIRGRAHFFDFDAGVAHVAAWDTNYLVRVCEPAVGGAPSCADGAAETLAKATRHEAPFSIWLGHHPLRSNGEHGDAGDYEECFGADLPGGRALCPSLWPGEALAALAREHIVGKVDLALSGHDHTLQAFTGDGLGRTAVVVSGAGSKSNALTRGDRQRPGQFAVGGHLGFALVEATNTHLRVALYGVPWKKGEPVPMLAEDDHPTPLHSLCKARGGPWRRCDGDACCPALAPAPPSPLDAHGARSRP